MRAPFRGRTRWNGRKRNYVLSGRFRASCRPLVGAVCPFVSTTRRVLCSGGRRRPPDCRAGCQSNIRRTLHSQSAARGVSTSETTGSP